MNVSQAGINLIKEFEGFPAGGRPYWDKYGECWTRGFGETDGITKDSPRESIAEAEARLKATLRARYMPAVDALGREIGHVWSQNEYDALASVVWNLGPGIIGPSHDLGKVLRRKDWSGVPGVLREYDRAANGDVLLGLRRRRAAEGALFVRADHTGLGGYPADEVSWIREYDRLIRARRDPARRKVLRAAMLERRKRIWRVAQPRSRGGDGHGWGYRVRARRYRSLLARSDG